MELVLEDVLARVSRAQRAGILANALHHLAQMMAGMNTMKFPPFHGVQRSQEGMFQQLHLAAKATFGVG